MPGTFGIFFLRQSCEAKSAKVAGQGAEGMNGGLEISEAPPWPPRSQALRTYAEAALPTAPGASETLLPAEG